LESDDDWRAESLRRWGFARLGEDVIHLQAFLVAPQPAPLPPGYTIRPVGDRLSRYVSLHRAAFGTTYLTVERRVTWLDEPGYDPELDLVLADPAGDLLAFCVCWVHGSVAELGTIGVRPDRRRQGLGRLMARTALRRLADRGVGAVRMSTSATNAGMLAVAAAEGFTEERRTSWLRRRVAVTEPPGACALTTMSRLRSRSWRSVSPARTADSPRRSAP
jgi:ribosomal protein S18 acetylase RimI-like enzyme